MFAKPQFLYLTRSRWFSTSSAFDKQLRGCQSVYDLEQLILTSPKFSPFNCANAFRGLGKLGSRNTLAVEKVFALSKDLAFPPKELAMCLYAIAKFRLIPRLPQIFLVKLEGSQFHTFPPQSVSNTLWALAKLRFDPNDGSIILSELTRQFKNDMENFNAQALANSLWALAALRIPPVLVSDLWDTLERDLLRRELFEFNTQELCNVLWATAVLGQCVPNTTELVMKRLVEELLETRNLQSFKAQSLSISLWAIAVSRYSDIDAYFQRVSHEIVRRRAKDFSSQDISTTLYACHLAKFNVPQDLNDLFLEVVTRQRNLHEFSSQSLANIIWCLANQKVNKNSSFFNQLCIAVANECQVRLKKLSCKSIAYILHGLALGNHLEAAFLFESVSNWLCHQHDGESDMHINNLSRVLVSFALLEFVDERLCDLACEVFLQQEEEISEESVTHLFFALGAMGVPHPELLAALLRRLRHMQFSVLQLEVILGAMAELSLKHLEELIDTLVQQQLPQGESSPQILYSLASLDVLNLPSVQQLFFDAKFQPQCPETVLAWKHQDLQDLTLVSSSLFSQGKNVTHPGIAQARQTLGRILGNAIQMDHVLPCGLQVDGFLPEHNSCIQFLRKSQYLVNQDVKGSAQFTKRLLEKEGYRVYFVSAEKGSNTRLLENFASLLDIK